MRFGRAQAHIATLLAVYAVVAYRFWFVCDDAYITFRYAQNLAHGHGLVFNPGEFPPVEGYSDFLWLLLAFGLEVVRLSPDFWLPLFSAVCGGLLIVRVYKALRERLVIDGTASLFGVATLAAGPAFGCWATSGLETMPQALLTFLLFEALVLQPDPPVRQLGPRLASREWLGVAATALALSLIRTEGIAWVGVVVGVSLVARLIDRVTLRPYLAHLVRVLAPVVLVYAVYNVWRYQYFGTLVPNTALVKVASGEEVLMRGLKYAVLFGLTTVVPALAALAVPIVVRRERHGAWVSVALLAMAFPTYAVVVGGDFMPFGRLLVPALPFVALLLAGGLQELVRWRRGDEGRARFVGIVLVCMTLLPVLDLHLTPYSVRQALHFRLSDKEFLSELNRWGNQRDNTTGFTKRGLALRQIARSDEAVVAAAVGAVGYWSGIFIYDQHGLVTKEVAYRDLEAGPLTESPGHDKHVEPVYFAKYEPKFLYARAVEGRAAAGRMKDSLDQWAVPASAMDRYVPDYYEVQLPGADVRTFLFVVRLVAPGEDPAAVWAAFAGRRRSLNAELRSQYSEDSDGWG